MGHFQSALTERVYKAAMLGTLVLQERARWLNLTNLSDREKDDILNMQIAPDVILGSVLVFMQRRCEAKKKEDEVLQFCLPLKLSATSQPAQDLQGCGLPAPIVPHPKVCEASIYTNYFIWMPLAKPFLGSGSSPVGAPCSGWAPCHSTVPAVPSRERLTVSPGRGGG